MPLTVSTEPQQQRQNLLRAGPTHRHRQLILCVILAVAFILRLVFSQSVNMAWPDEVFQTREPAHHLAFGPWIITWEYVDGARNWIFPAVLSVVMRATAWMGPGANGYLLGIEIALSLLSLVPIYFAALWAERYEGIRGAIVTAFACACWYELIYYGAKALNEVVAADLLLPGLYLLYFAPGKLGERNISTACVGAFLLGTSMAMRMQIAPIVLVALLWCCRKCWSQVPLVVLYIALPLATFGLVDYFTWGTPFQSYLVNYRFNTAPGPHPFGTSPWSLYVVDLFRHFGLLIPLAVLGAARIPFLGCLALILIAVHSAVPHKEYRFLNPVLMIIVLLAAIGLLNLLDAATKRVRLLRVPSFAPLLACLFIAFCSIRYGLAFDSWKQLRGGLALFSELNNERTLCGVGLVETGFYLYGGYTYLHRNIPIYSIDSFGELPQSQRAFNVFFSDSKPRGRVAPFTLVKCDAGICEYRRPGGCVPTPQFEINHVLAQGVQH